MAFGGQDRSKILVQEDQKFIKFSGGVHLLCINVGRSASSNFHFRVTVLFCKCEAGCQYTHC